MKITINNFKAITSPLTVDLNGINIIAGQNSGGKSSVIQSLLFLKQNIEDRIENDTLKFNAPYLSLGKFSDVVSKNVNNGALDFTIHIDANDIKELYPRLNKSGDIQSVDYHVSFVSVQQQYKRNILYIDKILIKVNGAEAACFSRTKSNNFKANCLAKYLHFFDDVKRLDNLPVEFKTKIDVGDILLDARPVMQFNNNPIMLRIIGGVSSLVRKKFQNIHYIGPLRESPKNYYYFEDSGSSQVGITGEFTPQFLAKNYNRECKYYKVTNDGKLSESPQESNIFSATKYWLCDHFNLGSDLTLDNDSNGVLYQINVATNREQKKASINNVGFGVSQILPIIVQGMAMKEGSLIILEQPEIHLHPTAQAKLFDFFNSLHKNNKSVLVETHSDHLVTRLRRRVAESEDELEKSINLIFVEFDQKNCSTIYKPLSMDELGNFSSWPKGFFDQYDQDIRAILQAQIVKKKKFDSDQQG